MVRTVARLFTCCTLTLAGLAPINSAVAADITVETSSFIPLPPSRLLDTRDVGRPKAGETLRVRIAGVAGVPDNAVAVSMNVTIDNAQQPGFVTVWPAGVAQPTASNLNIDHVNQTTANAVVVPLGTDGSVDIFDQPGGHVIIDVNGAWTPAARATAGRLNAVGPVRLLDTRGTPAVETRRLQLGSWALHASTAVVNLTVTNPVRGGFVTLWPAGTLMPQVSTPNIEHPQQTLANMAIVPLGLEGAIDIWTASGADVIVDLVGTFTDSSASADVDGLYVPVVPHRTFDSREASDGPIRGGWRRDIPVVGRNGVPATGVGAIFANVTATEVSLPTFLTVYPAGTTRPNTSNLNIEQTFQTLPNLVLARVGAAGAVSLYSQRTTHAIVDTVGYFTGSPATADPTVPESAPTPVFPSGEKPLRRVGDIGGAISPKSVVANGTGLVYAQNMMYNHTVTVYNRDGALVRTLSDHVGPLQGAPVEAAVFPGGRQMYVSNYSMYGPGAGQEGFDACSNASPVGESTVYRITGLAIDQVIPVGKVPKYLAVSPDRRWLVVSNWSGEDISIVDVAQAKEVKRVHVGRNPRGLAITADSSQVFVALMGEGRVATVSLSSGDVTQVVSVGGGARHLNLSGDGQWLYVTLNEESSVVKLDARTLNPIGRAITGTQPRSAALSQDGRYLYVVNYESATASKVRTSDMTVVDTVETFANPIGITYDDEAQQLWVSCYVGRILIFRDGELSR